MVVKWYCGVILWLLSTVGCYAADCDGRNHQPTQTTNYNLRYETTTQQMQQAQQNERSNQSQHDSNENSDMSENEDIRLNQLIYEEHKKRRKKKPNKWRTSNRFIPTEHNQFRNGETNVSIMHEDTSFIGDQINLGEKNNGTLRVATNNINKGIMWKIEEEIGRWFAVNRIDIMIIADPGLNGNYNRVIWSKAIEGGKTPSMALFGNKYIAVLMDNTIWADRADFREAKFSPSGRSMYVLVRLGGREKLGLIATYMPPNPTESINETENEFRWIVERKNAAENEGAWVIIAGDINNYHCEENDREGTAIRSSTALNRSEWYGNWMLEQEMISTFRTRHPQLQRYTYERQTANGYVKSTLDDILISISISEKVIQSGIGLNHITYSDHIGTHITDIRTNIHTCAKTVERQTKQIKTIPVKAKLQEEYDEFKYYTQYRLEKYPNLLIDELRNELSEEETLRWLEKAIKNLHTILYQSAKELWGETSNTKKKVNRNIAVQRSIKCNGCWKNIMRNTGEQRHEIFNSIIWPNWIKEPNTIPDECPHKVVAIEINTWIRTAHEMNDRTEQWYNKGWSLWKKAMRIRRNWRNSRKKIISNNMRQQYMQDRKYKKLINNILGSKTPPVNIHSVIRQQQGDNLITDRKAVQEGLTELLENWIPPDEKTVRPKYLDTGLDEDRENLPRFVKEWMLEDIQSGGILKHKFHDNNGNSLWDEYTFDQEVQQNVDKSVSRGVAPGEGGVPQELWINAPEIIRARERLIMNKIFKLGKIPNCLKDKQMVFLPKCEKVTNILDRRTQILPPWRPITVMRAFSTRLFTAVSKFFDGKISNHINQYGFQKDKTAHDAAILTTLLLERAKQKNEAIHSISKDCLKCYDRIPSWVMELIYQQLGVPLTLRKLIIDGLGKGNIRVRTQYGWIDTGKREFGIGQGSVMAITHIGCYMDVLQHRQNKGIDPIKIKTYQGDEINIHGVTYVDDQVDYSTSVKGIQQRVNISNMFTGRNATGGVFGAEKSFYLYHDPKRSRIPEVRLADGINRLSPVRMISPAEGFKHLGVYQSTKQLWSTTISQTWEKFEKEAKKVESLQLTAEQIRYIVNNIWIPRLTYRMVATSSIKIAHHIDSRIRRTVRKCLRLPYSTPKEIYYDKINGIGLNNCHTHSSISRVYETMRIINSDNSTVKVVMNEALEQYQINAGLTSNPLENPFPPPVHINTWLTRTIKCMHELKLKNNIKWINPPISKSTRPRDKPMWEVLDDAGCQLLCHLNYNSKRKARYVGDLCNRRGDILISLNDIISKFAVPRTKEKIIETIYNQIRNKLCIEETRKLSEPIGYDSIQGVLNGYVRATLIPPQSMVITSQFKIVDDELEYTGYEIGRRIGNEIQDDPYGNGILIKVQWFQTRNELRGIFTPRPNSILWEYDDVCLPIDVTTCTRSTHRAPRVLVWNDTTEHGKVGPNDRSLCQTIFQKAKQRFNYVMQSGRNIGDNNICVKCGRFAPDDKCTQCNKRHHHQCGHAEDTPEYNIGIMGITEIGQDSTMEAGDGSVTGAGSEQACGVWSYIGPIKSYAGKLNIHWKDINSTRCELHALIIGLQTMGDVGNQICDNKSAITIFNNVRFERRNGRKLFVKYSNPYRNEMKALYNLMNTKGTRQVTWVRSHQENMNTDNEYLKLQRNALALADAEATYAHERIYINNYDKMVLHDSIVLLSQNGNAIMGNVQHAISEMAERNARKKWIEKTTTKRETRQTIPIDGITIRKYMHMSNNIQRFYWRTISYTLHTNAIKHRMNSEWDPRCRGCNEHIDDQTHRFGIDNHPCIINRCTKIEINNAIEKALVQYTHPDVTIYIPQRDHDEAAKSNMEKRTMWKQKQHNPWKPMVQISAGIWLNIRQRKIIWNDETAIEDIATCVIKEKILMGKQKSQNITPFSIINTIKNCSPTIARLEFVPTELMSCVNRGISRQGLIIPGPHNITNPGSNHNTWLIDETYAPLDDIWWRDMCEKIQRQTYQNIEYEYWIITYPNSDAIEYLQNLGVQWYINIPKDELQTRTDYTVRQFGETPKLSELWKTNSKPVWIGQITNSCTTEQKKRVKLLWQQFCRAYKHLTWLTCPNSVNELPEKYLAATSIGWLQTDIEISTAENEGADWLRTNFVPIYEAPIGWRFFPSPTEELLRWAHALVYHRAPSLVRSILQNIWGALYEHWCHSSAESARRITNTAEQELLIRINNEITERRNGHDNSVHPLNRLLQNHRQVLHRQEVRWHRKHGTHQIERGSS